MGVNVKFWFEVRGLSGEEEAKGVTEALAELVKGEDLEDEVGLGWSVEEGVYWVSGETDYPVGIARFYAWRPRFEDDFQGRVRAVAPGAVATINWEYPDEE
ncbi:hypothetical protein [Nocardia blacklockiae]|uniref:hypothetical protein n=1 Tax=Nocardia blacklockiae TaxID=480036 RepID=UPI0018941D74|nr:hypothetical protein [Nocardia blacklockiae]MBF6175256.1 hypothetical protein [Nocardia blacklockiae]